MIRKVAGLIPDRYQELNLHVRPYTVNLQDVIARVSELEPGSNILSRRGRVLCVSIVCECCLCGVCGLCVSVVCV